MWAYFLLISPLMMRKNFLIYLDGDRVRRKAKEREQGGTKVCQRVTQCVTLSVGFHCSSNPYTPLAQTSAWGFHGSHLGLRRTLSGGSGNTKFDGGQEDLLNMLILCLGVFNLSGDLETHGISL